MERVSHDLPGVTQRIAKLADYYEDSVTELEQVWTDEKGRQFVRKHLRHIRPTVGQLVSSLTESIELFDAIARQVRDPDRY